MLTYEKCTSTSEHEVETAISGFVHIYIRNDSTRTKRSIKHRLAEKYSIKGYGKLSKALIEHKTEFLKMSRPIGSPHSNVKKKQNKTK